MNYNHARIAVRGRSRSRRLSVLGGVLTMKRSRVPLVLALAVIVAGCESAPVTGRKQFMLVPESQAISASTEAYAQTLDPIRKEGKLNDDAALKARIDKITARLVA